MTVAEYLLTRLRSIGIEHVFGVPGDFVIKLCKAVEKVGSPRWVGVCNELDGAYAADGYARIKGAGAEIVTYGVGDLSALNGIAGAFAEHVPVVLISGFPDKGDWKNRRPLHHVLDERYTIPKKILKRVTVATAFVRKPRDAQRKIDHALRACMRKSRPVFIQISQDIVDAPIEISGPILPLVTAPEIDQLALGEAAAEVAAMVNASGHPVFVVDGGVRRERAIPDVNALVEHSGIPYVAMTLGKGLVNEDSPLFAGMYMGNRSVKAVAELVDRSDCVVQLGLVVTDFNTGGFTVDTSNVIRIGEGSVYVVGHEYKGVPMAAFVTALRGLLLKRHPDAKIVPATETMRHTPSTPFVAKEPRITSGRLFDRISHAISPGSVVVSDIGVASYGSVDLHLPKSTRYISQPFYSSIGFSVPATLGACLADPSRKALLVVGDGAFQMTSQELSTIIRENCNVTVVLINNDGYTIERFILEGSFNDINRWSYSDLPRVFGAKRNGVKATTEAELDTALREASGRDGLSFIEVIMDRNDAPLSLADAASTMGSR